MSDTIRDIQAEQDLKTRKDVLQRFKSGDDISPSLIQRKCAVGYNTAYRTLSKLIEDGLVQTISKNGVCKFL